ncbi:microcystin dependent MdpB family protein [Azorhizobium oxalatiphilum]|uniref:Microcystin dependent MdpB family protein n=1 Tax=Azorhizobium oxalatiphilum TaxID=980631 RepID=A0A917C208_9HYPH|nr:tail fiber protein [Azorhizobium oxalatiphilum]GGF66158.1 microcystin dependent MdpB family protein [Azorhizobium oxalatiphilum]
MSNAYCGEIRPTSFTFAPEGWHICDGSLLSIGTYQVLYSLIGTAFGGNGVSTFALPDLRGRLPVDMGQRPNNPAYAHATSGGNSLVALQTKHLPPHTHAISATTEPAISTVPGPSAMLATTNATIHTYNDLTKPGTGDAAFSPLSIDGAGAGAAHENIMPCMPMTYIICLGGIYPDFG